MRSFYARGVALAIVLAAVAGRARGQDAGMPSLLPLPPISTHFPVARTSATYAYGDPSPAQVPGAPLQAPMPESIQAPTQSPLSNDYMDAMKGGYESCTASCGQGGACCGCGHYIYANALAMTNYRNGGTVTSIDSIDGSQRINFCDDHFGGNWHGGLEVGTGWCFGCNCSNAFELVYWGLYPQTMYRTEFDNLNSLIDFSSLDYNGANAQTFFDGALIHVVQHDFTFNSFEANLVGNSVNGGPFGCGMVGCNSSCSRWGAGWVAGFRYLNFGDRFIFSSDTADAAIDGNDEELNYAMQYNNNLVGFQVGGGLSYNITDRFSAYSTAKFGVFNNHVTGVQQVYGALGNATINAPGAFNGQDFLVRSDDNILSCAGQWDLGGRWAINNCWSINAGYRVMSLAGVATTDTNIKSANFHDVDGIASQDGFGSFIVHGAFAGVTFAW